MSIVDDTAGTRSTSVTITDVKVSGRFRKDLGDLSDLKASIDAVGLLHPIVVTPDLLLVAGQRRLEAMRELGAIEIPARIVDDLSEAAVALVAERDENTCRKPMAASELYALGSALEELERPRSAARQASAGSRNLGIPSSDRLIGTRKGDDKRYETREVVGPAVGMSGPQWQRLKSIGDRASGGDPGAAATLSAIDAGKQTISGGHEQLRKRDQNSPPADIGNVGNIRSVPRKKGADKQLRQLADKVKGLGNLASMIDLDGLTGEEAASIADDLGEGLSALVTLKNQLRKVTR